MLFAWWVASIELPGRNLFAIVVHRGVERHLAPLSIWAFGLTQTWMKYRAVAVVLIILAAGAHYFLSTRHPRYDVYGKWLFRTGFLVFYIALYLFFLLVFLGAELPVWTWPSQIAPVAVDQQ